MQDNFKAKLKESVREIITDGSPENLNSFNVLCGELSQLTLCAGGVHSITGRKLTPMIYENILQLILTAHTRKQESEIQTQPDGAEYWKQVEKAEKAIKSLASQFRVVRDAEVVLYHPDELKTCPHGEVRFQCEEWYAQRHRIELMDQPPMSETFPAVVERVMAENSEVAERPLSDFCEMRYRIPPHRPENTGGPEKEVWKDGLVADVTGILIGGVGLPVMEAIGFTHRILQFVFGDTNDRQATYRRWHRIKKEKEKDSSLPE